MTKIQKALLLAATMIGISILAKFGIVPESIAQWAPLGLLALFPSVWMGIPKKCGAAL